MDNKEVFLKSKLKRIASDFSDSNIDVTSDIIDKIMLELSDIYDEGFDRGYDEGFSEGYDRGYFSRE